MGCAVDDLANWPSGRRSLATQGRQVAGGYITFSVTELVMVWWLYQTHQIELFDLRVWFGCSEMVCRRRWLSEGREPIFATSELGKLVGAGTSRVRAALRRLSAVGALAFTRTKLKLATSPECLQVPELEGFWELLEQVENHKRTVPVPRRLVKFIAGGTSRVMTATLLAHFLRCLYLRGGKTHATGNCLAPWVAAVFGVNESNVKSARARLVALGVFLEQPMPQWHRNRYGARISVNLAWEAPKVVGSCAVGEGECSKSRPPAEVVHNKTATPYGRNSALPTEGNNQELGATPPNPTGVFEQAGKRKRETPSASGPSLKHFVPEDLHCIARLEKLHAEAVECGLAPSGERGLQELTALASHASRYATKNPPGLFAQLLRDQKWHFITQEDEDIARERLREHRAQGDRSRAMQPDASAELARDEEARLQVQRLEVRRLAGEALSRQAENFLEATKARVRVGEGSSNRPLAGVLSSLLGEMRLVGCS